LDDDDNEWDLFERYLELGLDQNRSMMSISKLASFD